MPERLNNCVAYENLVFANEHDVPRPRARGEVPSGLFAGMRSPPSEFERAPRSHRTRSAIFSIPSRGNGKEIQRRRRLLAAVTALCERINTALAGNLIKLDKEFSNAVKNVLVGFDAILRNIA